MAMADDYIAALGEAVYIIAREDIKDAQARTRAVASVVARFEPGSGPDHLKLSDVRDTAAETRRIVEQLTQLLDRTNELMNSGEWEQRVAAITAPASAVVDRMFYRGVILVLLLVAGMGLVRLIPSRSARPAA